MHTKGHLFNLFYSFVTYCNELSSGDVFDKCFLTAMQSELDDEGLLRGFDKLSKMLQRHVEEAKAINCR